MNVRTPADHFQRLVEGGPRRYSVSVDVIDAPGHSEGTYRIECIIRDALLNAGINVTEVEVETE